MNVGDAVIQMMVTADRLMTGSSGEVAEGIGKYTDAVMELDRLGILEGVPARDIPERVAQHVRETGPPLGSRTSNYTDGIAKAQEVFARILQDESP